MTIAERKAREAHDRENPWRPMSEKAPVGLICDLLFDDMVGHFAAEGVRFFLDADGNWYRADASSMPLAKAINWRPAYCFLTPERRALLKSNARRAL
ncbi:hypothetical protein [Neorhizobium sp. NCHU2750]|uniref:hypothetical protein n=1 Tax=Neorhizobium sp. NCHU2750 TaxID=1825976 RepID=UPI000E74E299|nr:hypothetical protein NCHU2750_28300 [Neorhizobium sp. NCHU2750]